MGHMLKPCLSCVGISSTVLPCAAHMGIVIHILQVAVHINSGTPAFMAIEVLEGKAQTTSSDLESLMYCFLSVATGGHLIWKDLPHIRPKERPAIHTKYTCMSRAGDFDSYIVGHIEESSLVPIAKSLRALFFKDATYEPTVSAIEFIAALG